MSTLSSARAKLAQGNWDMSPAELEALAVWSATQPAEPVTEPPMTMALIDQVLEIAAEYPPEKARQIIRELFAERVTVFKEQVWDADAFKGIG